MTGHRNCAVMTEPVNQEKNTCEASPGAWQVEKGEKGVAEMCLWRKRERQRVPLKPHKPG